ncbi:MAG: hypothetical protein AAGK00_13405 [Pseudomonadota bacterium]
MAKNALIIALMAAVLTGCTIGPRMVIAAERERLAKLRAWEQRLAPMDCAQLGVEVQILKASQDDLLDADQREDTLRDIHEEKACPWPDDA